MKIRSRGVFVLLQLLVASAGVAESETDVMHFTDDKGSRRHSPQGVCDRPGDGEYAL